MARPLNSFSRLRSPRRMISNPKQPISIDRVAASIAKGLVDKSNEAQGTRRVLATREELNAAYRLAMGNARKQGLIFPGTNQLTPKGVSIQAEAAEKFRPEMQQWLDASLAHQRKLTEKKNMKKAKSPLHRSTGKAKLSLRRPGSAKNPSHRSLTLAEIYGLDLRSLPPAYDRRANPKKSSMAKPEAASVRRHSVSTQDAKSAIQRAASETGHALWSGSKWAGERLWAGTKEGAKLAARGARKTAKVGARYTAKGLDWSANKLEKFAERPNPSRDMSRMTPAQRMAYVRSFRTAKNPSQSSSTRPASIDMSRIQYTGPTLRLSGGAGKKRGTPKQCSNCRSFVARAATSCPKCKSAVR